MADAIKSIQQDHVNLGKVLDVLLEVGTDLPTRKSGAELATLNDAVYYIQVFAERFHHPKEERILFPFIREHRPELGDVIDVLEAQHNRGAGLISELATRLRQLENDWAAVRVPFQELVQTYVQFQREHIGLEEREILKPMRETSTAADLAPVNSAYGVSSDPLFGDNLADGFRALLKRIST